MNCIWKLPCNYSPSFTRLGNVLRLLLTLKALCRHAANNRFLEMIMTICYQHPLTSHYGGNFHGITQIILQHEATIKAWTDYLIKINCNSYWSLKCMTRSKRPDVMLLAGYLYIIPIEGRAQSTILVMLLSAVIAFFCPNLIHSTWYCTEHNSSEWLD